MKASMPDGARQRVSTSKERAHVPPTSPELAQVDFIGVDHDAATEGYARVAHRNTAARGPKGEKMSDAAFRAWVALDRWAWKDECPTNAEIAVACDWFDESGKPAAWKAKRALRELEAIGKAKRVTAKSEIGFHQREAIKLVRPF